MKKGNLTAALLIVAFLAGVCLMLYPTVSNYWNSLHQSRAISYYAEDVSALDSETCERLLGEARAYNESILGRTRYYEMTDQEVAAYSETLDVSGTGIMGYLEVPAIDCSLPIYHGTDESVLQVAVGHVEWTSLPVGGNSTHSVLMAHRGLPSAKLFSNLDRLAEGDTFVIRVLNETLTYEVDQILTVLPSETEALKVSEGRDYCTLVTCTPYGINTHRLLVRGHRVPNAPSADDIRITADAAQIQPLVVAGVMAAPVVLVLALWALIPARRKR